jgi:hypothetical protein
MPFCVDFLRNMIAMELVCPDTEKQEKNSALSVFITYPYHKMNVLKNVERPF